jgi:hypothetical protein
MAALPRRHWPIVRGVALPVAAILKNDGTSCEMLHELVSLDCAFLHKRWRRAAKPHTDEDDEGREVDASAMASTTREAEELFH